MAAALMPDQKSAGRTLTPQASGPHVLLSRLSEHLSEGMKRQRREGGRRTARDSQIHPSRPSVCDSRLERGREKKQQNEII